MSLVRNQEPLCTIVERMAVRDEDFGTALTPAEGDDWIGSPPEAVPACEPCDWRSLFERERARAERERARADAAQGRCEELRWAEVQARSDGGTAYPLSAVVGEALLDYLKHARPTTPQRQIFFNVLAPRVPMGWNAIANRAAHYLHKAGIRVRRPGSHTLRHSRYNVVIISITQKSSRVLERGIKA